MTGNNLVTRITDIVGINMNSSIARDIIQKEKILYPKLYTTRKGWLVKYSDYDLQAKEDRHCKNKLIYHLDDKQEYKNCVLDFTSGMSDTFAIDVFNEVITF